MSMRSPSITTVDDVGRESLAHAVRAQKSIMLPEKRAKKKYNDRWTEFEAGHRKLLTATTIEPEESSLGRAASAAFAESKESLGARQAGHYFPRIGPQSRL